MILSFSIFKANSLPVSLGCLSVSIMVISPLFLSFVLLGDVLLLFYYFLGKYSGRYPVLEGDEKLLYRCFMKISYRTNTIKVLFYYNIDLLKSKLVY